jgi:hypothetical protein
MKRFVVPVIFLFPVLLLAFWVYLGTTGHQAIMKQAKSVAERVQEYGPAARARLQPFFDAAQVPVPPARLVLVGLKQEKVLEVYAAGTNQNLRFIRSYPILAASGVAGPKLREGDQQVPEGIYRIESLNPNSQYHLALRVNYPNSFDREQAGREDRSELGGDIMIHGGSASIGCLAMGDEAAEDLFVLAANTGIDKITVILSPVDFRRGKAVPAADQLPTWTGALYQTIRSNLNELPPAK